jgi:antitoxin component YwqK of YwqJK toxin-antitoxin module
MKNVILFLLTLASFTLKAQKTVSYEKLYVKDSVVYYKKKPFTGCSISYYPNGKIKEIDSLKKGKLNGMLILYDSLGGYKLKATFKDNVLNGPYSDFFDDGTPYSGMMINGLREGDWYNYSQDSIILVHDRYLNGEEIPITFKEYYENGQLKSVSNFLHDNRIGTWIVYFRSGQINVISNWENDVRQGETIEYDENGNVKCKKTFDGGSLIKQEGDCK